MLKRPPHRGSVFKKMIENTYITNYLATNKIHRFTKLLPGGSSPGKPLTLH